LPATTAASTPAAATAGDLCRWHDGSGRLDLPAPATAATATATGAPFGRTRLNLTGPAHGPAPHFRTIDFTAFLFGIAALRFVLDTPGVDGLIIAPRRIERFGSLGLESQ
jgi:hypothetical protein